MIVTYALTMSALQQAYTTKKKRHTRRQKMHAVINLATIAMRWKRAINNETVDEQKNSTQSTSIRTEQKIQKLNLTSLANHHQRKRAASLLVDQQHSAGNKHLSKGIFISNNRLNETLKPLAPLTWYKRRDKQLQPLPERSSKNEPILFSQIKFCFFSVEQSSPSSHSHLDPDSPNNINTHTKRSRSCTPLLDVEVSRRDRLRSSSVHTLLQIRRDSAKISEELANLTAQLSAAMSNGGSSSKRPSLSVPGPSGITDNGTPTIDQLLAETNLNQTIVISSSYLTVDSNAKSGTNQQRRGRS
jgi:hypothetical protein